MFAAHGSEKATVHCFGAFLTCATYGLDALPRTTAYFPVDESYFQSFNSAVVRAPGTPLTSFGWNGGNGVLAEANASVAVKRATIDATSVSLAARRFFTTLLL